MNLKVKALMMRKGVTGRDIARKAGVSETWVSLVLNNRANSNRIRSAIARALGMKVERLWPKYKKAA